MAKLGARRVKWNGAGLDLHGIDLTLGDEQKLSLVVDEAADQPGAGHAVDVNVGTGNPFHCNPP
jgi:hypothetical protein